MSGSAMRRSRSIAALLALSGSALTSSKLAAQSSPGLNPSLSQSLSGYGASPNDRRFGGGLAPPDPLARGAGFVPYVDLAERAVFGDQGTGPRLYTDVGVGADAFLNRDRAQGTLTFRLNDRIPVVGDARNQLLVNGLGRGQFDLIRNRLFFDVSTYADVVARDYAQGVAIDQATFNRNLTQIYYVSAGPRLQRDLGTLALVNARYSASYTAVDNRLSGGTGLSGGLGGGATGGGGAVGGNGGTALTLQPLSNSFSQTGELSISNQPRDGRLLASLTGRIVGQEQARLKQEFRSHIVTADLTYAITRPVALVGSVGYEDYRSTQQQIQLQPLYLTGRITSADLTKLTGFPANTYIIPGTSNAGIVLPQTIFRYAELTTPILLPSTQNLLLNPVFSTINPTDLQAVYTGTGANQKPVFIGNTQTIDPRTGDYVADPTLPRQQTYAQKGLVWNIGARYTPTRSSLLELRVGQRFNDVTVTGIVRQQFRNGLLITGALTDGIETFGTILTRLVNGVPVSFVTNGRNGSLGSGPQSVSSGVFRSRIGTIGASIDRGAGSYGIEYTYNNRRYLDAGSAIASGPVPIDPNLVSRSDVTQTVTVRGSRRLDARQTVDVDLLYGNYSLGLTRRTNDNYLGAQARYNYRFDRGFNVFASASITQRFVGANGDTPATQSFLVRGRDTLFTSIGVGARYRF